MYECVVGGLCPWSSCRFVCLDTRSSVCNGFQLGFVIGGGSEFAVMNVTLTAVIRVRGNCERGMWGLCFGYGGVGESGLGA